MLPPAHARWRRLQGRELTSLTLEPERLPKYLEMVIFVWPQIVLKLIWSWLTLTAIQTRMASDSFAPEPPSAVDNEIVSPVPLIGSANQTGTSLSESVLTLRGAATNTSTR